MEAAFACFRVARNLDRSAYSLMFFFVCICLRMSHDQPNPAHFKETNRWQQSKEKLSLVEYNPNEENRPHFSDESRALTM